MTAVCLHFLINDRCLFTFLKKCQLFVYSFEKNVSCLFTFLKKCQLFVYIFWKMTAVCFPVPAGIKMNSPRGRGRGSRGDSPRVDTLKDVIIEILLVCSTYVGPRYLWISHIAYFKFVAHKIFYMAHFLEYGHYCIIEIFLLHMMRWRNFHTFL